MFYCTFYTTFSNRKGTRVFSSYSYDSEHRAQSLLDFALDQARACDATIEVIDGYYYITGKLKMSFGNMFVKDIPSSQTSHYIIGIESDSTLGSLVPNKAKSEISARDGVQAEKIMAHVRERNQAYRAEKQKKNNNNLKRFFSELDATTELKDILRLVIKYAGQGVDKEKLIDIAIQKIQGNIKPVESTSWYDELSDINS